jgi:hypothetical protein
MTKLTKEKPRLIQGVLLKCTDGRWADADGLSPPAEMLVIGTTRALQCWGKDKDLVDVIIEQPGAPLPDVDDLNSKIPQKEWGLGLDGKPRPPWQLNRVVYLLDVTTASTYTFANSTTGARIAVDRLEDKIKWMRAMRGNQVAPIVKLDSRGMKTAFGAKQRPEFTVLKWRDLASGSPGALQIEHQPEPEPVAADANKSTIASATAPATKPEPAKKKPKSTVGKSIKPVTIQEELDDDIPEFLKRG